MFNLMIFSKFIENSKHHNNPDFESFYHPSKFILHSAPASKLLHTRKPEDGSCVSLSRIQLFCDPMNYIAHQAPLSMGFSRWEYWSGSPFPPPGDLPDPGIQPSSPACVLCLLAQLCLTLCDPMHYSPWGSSVHGIFQARILEWMVAVPFSRESSQPRDPT